MYASALGSERMRNLTVRVDEETLQRIDETAAIEKIDRSTAARRLLDKGMSEYRREKALELYRSGGCTLWRAAELSGLGLREMMELAEKEKIPLHTSAEDVAEAWREALEG